MPLKYLFILYFFISTDCLAQVNVRLADVVKITMIERSGGMGSGSSNSYEVLNIQGKWLCYKTDTSYNNMFDEKHSTKGGTYKFPQPKLIAEISQDSLKSFLVTLANIKPTFNWRLYGMSAAKYLKQPILTKDTNEIRRIKIRQKYYTDSIIKPAVISVQNSQATDASITCGMTIIKKNRDTIKVSGWSSYNYMLPWKINGIESYDAGINRFLLLLIDVNAKYSNKSVLSIESSKAEVLDYIDQRYMQQELDLDDWKYMHPYNMKFLKENFIVSYLRHNNGGDECYLYNKMLPFSVRIRAVINMDSKSSIERLIRHRDSIINYIKLNNFVFDYYLDKPRIDIVFPWQFDFNTGSWFWGPELKKRLPMLVDYDFSQALYFELSKQVADQLYQSTWLILPDNKLVLITHNTSDIANIPPAVLHVESNEQYALLVLFDTNGKVLQVGK